MPFIYVAGMWMAVVSSIAFTGVYACRVAEEARLLANALAATELVLQREQHLSALDGLAAAAAHELGTPLATIALVAKEMERALGNDRRYSEDVKLLRSQSERCREILQAPDQPVVGGRRASLAAAADLADRGGDRAASRFRHRDQAVEPRRADRSRAGRPAQSGRHLRAWQSGRERRRFRPQDASPCAGAGTTQTSASSIIDDGPGFPPEIIDRIGEPYMSTRQGTEARRRPRPRPVHRQDAARTLGRHARFPQFERAGRGRRRADRRGRAASSSNPNRPARVRHSLTGCG